MAIEFEHHEIHAGDSYSCNVGDAVLAAASSVIVLFKTANTPKVPHVLTLAGAGGTARLDIFEDPNYNDNTGTTLPAYNRFRESLNTTSVFDTSVNPDTAGAATEDPTGVALGGGSLIHSEIFGSGNKGGGGSRGNAEWILVRDTVYAFVLTAITNNIPVTLMVNWYEHESVDV